MNQKSLFLLSSAIHTKHGQFTSKERMDQTLNTLKSIKEKIPDSSIILAESSAKQSVTDDEIKALSKYANIFNFHNDPQILSIYENSGDNWDIVKNYTELIVFNKLLHYLISPENHSLVEGIERVFKLSGRYNLTNDFHLENFFKNDYKDYYIFSQRRESQFDSKITNGLTYQYMSRLWSFPCHKMVGVYCRYVLMLEDFIGSLKNSQYRDIEHLLFRYFDGPYVYELPVIGVEGNIGPNKAYIRD